MRRYGIIFTYTEKEASLAEAEAPQGDAVHSSFALANGTPEAGHRTHAPLSELASREITSHTGEAVTG